MTEFETTYCDGCEAELEIGQVGLCEVCLKARRGAKSLRKSPADHLPKVPFVGAGSNVMCGPENVAVARSRTFANRIANALNQYTPNSKGE